MSDMAERAREAREKVLAVYQEPDVARPTPKMRTWDLYRSENSDEIIGSGWSQSLMWLNAAARLDPQPAGAEMDADPVAKVEPCESVQEAWWKDFEVHEGVERYYASIRRIARYASSREAALKAELDAGIKMMCSAEQAEHTVAALQSANAELQASLDRAVRELSARAEELERLKAVVKAARCIRHWHDAMSDNSGMVVSSEHVRLLWKALEQYDALAATAPSADAKEDAC